MSASARIFMNYRRSDSAGWAGRIQDDLAARFGAERVFRDVRIEPGIDFVEHIERVMSSCEVCIVVIGKGWSAAAGADGRRRLDDPGDLVRLEIERALERRDVHVIPVLVDGAPMPVESELPGGLAPLARRNACELSDRRWDYDVEQLCGALRRALGESTIEHEHEHEHERDGDREQQPERRHRYERDPRPAGDDDGSTAGGEDADHVAGAVLVTLAATVAAGVLAALLTVPLAGSGEPRWGRLIGYAIERGVIWAIIGAVVAAVAAAMFGRARVPIGAALVGAGAGWLGGAAGGAGYMALKHFGGVTEQDAHWLLLFVVIALPSLSLAVTLARSLGGRAGECALAALAAAAVAALLSGGDRTILLTAHALLVIGATVAVLAAPSQRGLARGRARRSRRPAAT